MLLPEQATRIPELDPSEMKALMGQNSPMFARIGPEFRIEKDQALADKRGGVRRIPGGIDKVRLVTNPNQRAPRALM
jgi:hypothetical protein